MSQFLLNKLLLGRWRYVDERCGEGVCPVPQSRMPVFKSRFVVSSKNNSLAELLMAIYDRKFPKTASKGLVKWPVEGQTISVQFKCSLNRFNSIKFD